MTVPACFTVRTPNVTVTADEWAAIRSEAERLKLPKIHLSWLGLHVLATYPSTKETNP